MTTGTNFGSSFLDCIYTGHGTQTLWVDHDPNRNWSWNRRTPQWLPELESSFFKSCGRNGFSFSPARGLDWMLRTFSIFVTDMPAELGGAICKDFSVRMPTDIAWPSSITMMMAVLRRTIAHCCLPTQWGFRKLRGALLLWTAIWESRRRIWKPGLRFRTFGSREFGWFAGPWDNHEVMWSS